MWFKFTLNDRDGSDHKMLYNSYTSELRGDHIIPSDNKKPLEDWTIPLKVQKSNPENHLGKVKTPKTMKIQMGLACNYSCNYCNQAFEIAKATVSKLSDVEKFLTQLDTWLEEAPEVIELWGGEPFVYWAKMKRLIPALHEKFPNSQFLVITNGSMFDQERIEFIRKYDISIGISHDGPGQEENRGPDPFKDPEKRRWIEALVAERKDKVSFNTVLTKNNYDLTAIQDWFFEELGDDVNITLEGVVNTYDAPTLLGSGRFQEKELEGLSNGVFLAIANNPSAFSLNSRIDEFYNSIEKGRPIQSLGQKCGMDRVDDIAVDLQGNVMTCQNTGAKGVHKIGHVTDFDNIKLNTSTHLTFRDSCMNCPVVQLCKGSCMFLHDEFFEQSCKNELSFNTGILRGAMFHLTGKMLTNIEKIGLELPETV